MYGVIFTHRTDRPVALVFSFEMLFAVLVSFLEILSSAHLFRDISFRMMPTIFAHRRFSPRWYIQGEGGGVKACANTNAVVWGGLGWGRDSSHI